MSDSKDTYKFNSILWAAQRSILDSRERIEKSRQAILRTQQVVECSKRMAILSLACRLENWYCEDGDSRTGISGTREGIAGEMVDRHMQYGD